MTGRGEAQWYRNMVAELPKLSTFRPVQNSVYNAKRRMAYGPVRRLSSACHPHSSAGLGREASALSSSFTLPRAFPL